jgi:hypothetical protein
MKIPPLNVDLSGKVEKVVDTGKVFTSGGIQKRKYLVYFDDGYIAEYTPAVHHVPNFKGGDTITYQIRFRNDKGDVIEPVATEGGATPIRPSSISPVSMMGHPAAIALTIAKDMAAYNNWDGEQMREQAEANLKWLLERRDIDQYEF